MAFTHTIYNDTATGTKWEASSTNQLLTMLGIRTNLKSNQ